MTRMRHRLRTRVAEHPVVYLPFARRKYPGPSPKVVDSSTQLVIDGYTRSACTFAVYALQLSQPAPVRIAHHLHAPAQFIEAARRGIPALLVIREPEGTILSQVIREPGVTVRDALISYARFHARLLSYRDAFVVAEFEAVTHAFAGVVRRLNTKFGTSFKEFLPSEPNLREISELIRLRGTLSRTLLGFESGEVSRQGLQGELEALGRARSLDAPDAWVPSEARERAKLALREEWRQPSLTRLRERAQRLYQTFVAGR